MIPSGVVRILIGDTVFVFGVVVPDDADVFDVFDEEDAAEVFNADDDEFFNDDNDDAVDLVGL